MTDLPTQHKALFAPLKAAQYDFEEGTVRTELGKLFAPDAVIHMPHPIGDLSGPGAFYDKAYAPLFKAIPDLERRDYIIVAGPTDRGDQWLGCGGYYTGTFKNPWMDIPPTGHMVAVRFHEFYKFEDGKVTEFQTIWDLPDVMMQAGAWPMQPSLGREWLVPGPATEDGYVAGPYDAEESRRSCQHVVDMLTYLKKHPSQGGPEVMDMPRFWHERMSWYGPSGIGTGRGMKGFRDWHQIPFLNGMPDRGQYVGEIIYHFFGDKNYVAVTGWPNMIQTVSHDGWLGIAPVGKRITMKSLDFWRIENTKIRENWVMVDILDAYNQLGVDVFARMREFNKARQGFDPEMGHAL